MQRLQQQNYRPLVRVAVVLGVILLAVAAALVDSHTVSLILMGLPIGIGIVLIFMRHPGLGLVAMIPASFVIPFEIGVSSGSSLNPPMLIIMLMTGLWVLDMVVIKRRIAFNSPQIMLPAVVLIVIVILAFINGQLPWFAFANKAPITAQIGEVALFVLSVSIFLVAAHQIKSLVWLKAITWVYLGIGLFFFIMETLPVIKAYSLRVYSYGALTSLFWVWMVALSLGQALYNRHLLPWQRIGLILVTLITMFYGYTLIPGWKSGWVPALAAAAVLIALYSPKAAIAMVIGAVISSPIFLLSLISTDEYSYNTRVEAWLLIAQIVKASPILGVGPANYYWYTPLFPIRGYAVQFNSHNQFVDLIAQVGLLGMGTFMWLMLAIGNLGWKLRRFAPEGFARGYVYSALAGLVGMLTAAMLGDWVIPFVYNVGFRGFRGSLFGWLFLGGLVALEKMIEKGEA